MRPTSHRPYMFFCRNQDAGETVESYITTLRKMAKTCNFGRLDDQTELCVYIIAKNLTKHSQCVFFDKIHKFHN